MTPNDKDRPPLEEPLAELERQLITTYLAGTGHEYHALIARNDAEAHRILAAASQYADEKLAEIETRAHYLRTLHGEP
jgi:hypothetical protein